jgi:hypothetical protein
MIGNINFNAKITMNYNLLHTNDQVLLNDQVRIILVKPIFNIKSSKVLNVLFASFEHVNA